MAKQPITMLQIRRILQLLQQGESKRKISQILHSGRHTIDDYVLKIESCGISLPLLVKLSDADLATLVYSGNKDPQPDPRSSGCNRPMAAGRIAVPKPQERARASPAGRARRPIPDITRLPAWWRQARSKMTSEITSTLLVPPSIMAAPIVTETWSMVP